MLIQGRLCLYTMLFPLALSLPTFPETEIPLTEAGLGIAFLPTLPSQSLVNLANTSGVRFPGTT